MIRIESFESKGERECAQRIAYSLLGDGALIGRRSTGAPFVVGRDDCHISISHTADRLAFMLSDRPCGVDIELVGRVVERLERRFASPFEKQLCDTVFPSNPSLLVWCAKEAVYKVLGREGVDFRRDMVVSMAYERSLFICAFGVNIALEWSVVDGGNILMVNTV